MRIKLQATGQGPFSIDVVSAYHSTEMLEGDKRGVHVSLFKAPDELWVGVVTYITAWGTERGTVWITRTAPLWEVAAMIREHAKVILPPGAGYPATPAFETRQAKLAGMMETLTLAALTKVLAEVGELP